MEVPDDRLDPPDRLSLQLELEAQHAVSRRMLRAEVDDLPLVFVEVSFALVVVGDQCASLHVQCRFDVVGEDLLSAFLGRGCDPVRLLRSR